MTGSLYRQTSGSEFQPTALTEGPWRPDAQHGGPPSALLLFLAEQLLQGDEYIARCHVELRARVPLLPLTGSASRTAVSGRVAQITSTLTVGGSVVALATTTALRGGPTELPEWTSSDLPPALPAPAARVEPPQWGSGEAGTPFHRHALEHRFVDGAFTQPGPARNWIRLTVPVVGGQALTAEQRVMAVADIGSGISALYSAASRFGMINADLDVTFFGPTDEEWLMLDAVTHLAANGTGVATTAIWGSNAQMAHATQVLLGYRF